MGELQTATSQLKIATAGNTLVYASDFEVASHERSLVSEIILV